MHKCPPAKPSHLASPILARANMVSTRNHPSAFPPPEPSPTKPSPRKSRNSTPAPTAEPDRVVNPAVAVGKSLGERTAANGSTARTEDTAWSHTASNLTVAWIVVSLPLVICTSILPPS